MIHHFTIGCWILLFLTPGYTPVFAKDEVIQVPRGLDATLRCRSTRSFLPEWEWDSKQTSENIKTLVVNSTAYLLVENFQEMNEGHYYCINGKGKKSAVELKIQLGITNTTPVYRISRTGSLHLSCEPHLGATLQGFWSWRQTGSEEDCKRSGSGQTGSEGDCKRSGSGQTGSEEDCKRSGSDLEHFGNRAEVKKNESENTLSISPLLWNDSGQYRCTLCDGNKHVKQCTYEIITVKVYYEPMELTEGEDGSLVCAVSHVTESTRLLWIDTWSQQMFSNPEARAHTGEFRLVVRNVTLAWNVWECAVFHQDRLRALVPFELMNSRAIWPPGPSGEISVIFPLLLYLSGVLLISMGTAFIIYRCWIHQEAAHSSTSAALANDNLTTEVVYLSVAMETGIGRK